MTLRSAHGLTTHRAADWRDAGACLGEDPELFHPDGTVGRWAQILADAKTICNRCPVREQCLQWAIDTRQEYGIFGGLDEYERQQLRRRQVRNARRPVQKPRGPKLPPPQSLQELFARHASPATAGHVTWSGANTPIFRGRHLTPYQLSFIVDRGREPEGPVKRLCEVKGCVQPKHLIDTAERTQCGTRPGYRRHRDRGEEACDDCKQANADADNRLRWTGTTKAAA
ncbi:WhiB family transcriptional regulator [Streptomyces sp. LBUM 1486]|uniref:WhiB family transcriptional regulator n=1 Tax=Streptomyces scabiei TaxID=1930 RepID=UPI001B3422E2|nr:WhiB family transcriptional regulator [Streptomyces sp. LBUM 1486]